MFTRIFLPLIFNALLADKKESTTIKPITETTTIVPDTAFDETERLHQNLLELESGVKNMDAEAKDKRFIATLRDIMLFF
jgi:hypothetical protein